MFGVIFNLTYFLTFICNHIYFIGASICMIANSSYSSKYSQQVTLMAFTVIHTFSQAFLQWFKYKTGTIETILQHKFHRWYDSLIHLAHFLVALFNIIVATNGTSINDNGLATLWNISLGYNIATFVTNSISHYISFNSGDSSSSTILSIV